jgi:hypothetical protein
MRQGRTRRSIGGLSLLVILVASLAWAQAPATPAPGKLTRLVVAVAPLGWDTNFTWLQSRSEEVHNPQQKTGVILSPRPPLI